MHASPAIKAAEVEYPSSDGKPMAETDLHRDWMVTNIQRLARYYGGQRVYVSGNLLIYYEKGDPRKSVAPDTFVVKNCKPGRREIFRIWQERRTPNFILETTSKKDPARRSGQEKDDLRPAPGAGVFPLRSAGRVDEAAVARLSVEGQRLRIDPGRCRRRNHQPGVGDSSDPGKRRPGDVRRGHRRTPHEPGRMGANVRRGSRPAP